MSDTKDVLETALGWMSKGETVCIATIVSKEGSGPREVGAKMAIASGGDVAGSIGGGAVEKKVLERAGEVLAGGGPVLVEFDLSGRARDLDALCGGKIGVFIEPVGRAKPLFVIGAGHVGRAVARLASTTGFAVTVVDDRQEYIDALADARGIRTLLAGPEDALGGVAIDATSSVVICTRGHSLDKEWLARMIDLGPGYLGMLGSKKKAASIFTALRSDGVARATLEQVHTPVGIEIGAVTPEEIAVSIVAELVREHRQTVPRSQERGVEQA